MKLITTTLSGNAQDTIGDALRSVVDHADICLIIDTGITDNTLKVAKEVCGEKLYTYCHPWRNDFSSARNYAAHAAFDYARFPSGWGPQDCWQMFVDTDERMHGMDGVRAVLESAKVDYFLVTHFSESHERERIFRLPVKGTWSGPTHEAYCDGGSSTSMPVLRTHELPKDPAQLQTKFQRDLEILERHTKAHPNDPRWFYYLGDVLQNLGRFQEAIQAYRACVALGGWREEGAWACFRAGICHAELGEFQQTVNACARGLAVHAGFAELAWLAGWACSKMGDPVQARAWAKMSVAIGHYEGIQKDFTRIGFKHLPGMWEGPYDVLRFCEPTAELRALAQRSWERAQAR